MNINLLELWSEMGMPVRIVVIVLTLQAVASLAVAVDRLILLFRSPAASAAFAAAAAKPLEEGEFGKVRELASKAQGSHLALVMFSGLDVFLKRTDVGDSTERAAELARRAIERKGESLSTSLNKGMGVLASTGSTAPFVGLLGTVLGFNYLSAKIAQYEQGLTNAGSELTDRLETSAAPAATKAVEVEAKPEKRTRPVEDAALVLS